MHRQVPKPETLLGYFEHGVKRVIVAAPVKDADVLNIVMGVNDDLYDKASHDLVTAASCTTNCLAPVVKVVHEAFGIRHGQITTIHNPTNTNVVIDAPRTGFAARPVSDVVVATDDDRKRDGNRPYFPELVGKLSGHAVRVPVLNASLTDCVFELNRGTDAEEVNNLFQEAAAGHWRVFWASNIGPWFPLISRGMAAAPSSTGRARW